MANATPFFIPEEGENTYENATAFKSYWEQPDGSVLEYVVTGADMRTTRNGQARLEVEVKVASGEHVNKEPRPLGIPNDSKFLWMHKQFNEAVGVPPQLDPNTGRKYINPAWYVGKHFLATAMHRSEPSTKDPSKSVTYVDYKNMTSVATGQQAQTQQAAPPQTAPAMAPPAMGPAMNVAPPAGPPMAAPIRRAIPGVVPGGIPGQ